MRDALTQDSAPSSQSDCGRINPVSIVLFNFLACATLGYAASLAELGSFAVITMGWFGGSALTVALLGVYAVRSAERAEIEPEELDPVNLAAPTLDEVMWAWDMDRAHDVAHCAHLRCWEDDKTLTDISDVVRAATLKPDDATPDRDTPLSLNPVWRDYSRDASALVPWPLPIYSESLRPKIGDPMEICPTKTEARAAVARLKADGASVGLVPTMGYLHDGHLALIRSAKSQCDKVVASIFVNPTQFDEASDLAAYPQDIARDRALLEEEGVDMLFLPGPTEMYHEAAQTVVETTGLANILIGAIRPGHFRGVSTIVTKLFNVLQPDVAFFGRKDYQQLQVIRTMVRDLDIPVEIVGVPTVREPDGLAMSSRNVRLKPEHRAAAPVLNSALDWAERSLPRAPKTAEVLATSVAARISEAEGAQVESVDVRDAETLAALSGPIRSPAVILLAVRFGEILLIDQRVVTP